MKKIISILFMVVSLPMCLSVNAQRVIIPLSCGIFDQSSITDKPARGPIDPPTVYLEDYTLIFEADHPEYILYIKDEDDAVVYSTVVSTTVTEVVLPSYLSGDYEIDLVMGYWLFTGWINL